VTMFPNPFELEGNWYRANLHTHSANSDGWMAPERVALAYRRAGYQVLAITDHDKLTDAAAFSAEGFLMLPGIECHLGQSELGHCFHVVGIGIDAAPSADLGLQALIDALAEAGAFVILAHPYWSGLTCADLMSLDGYHAVEVYNTVTDVMIARGHSMVHWDDLLTRRRAVSAVAVDDAHHGYDDMHQGWVMVKAPALTREAIVAALRAGTYYASTGPSIESVRADECSVDVVCSPVRRISLIGSPALGANCTAGEGESLTAATLPVHPNSNYARVQITDHQGRMAWTQPVVWR
jgi:predicted metal-dependent phosphoesterase TrpH